MANWKILYRDDLDRDRTSRSIASKEAAFQQERDLHLLERAEIYEIVGPDDQTLLKKKLCVGYTLRGNYENAPREV
jgi:hypothetical protein